MEDNSDPQIHLTAFVLRDFANQQDILVDLTACQPDGIPIAPYLPIRFNHEVKLHVHHQVDGQLHDYEVLFGPDPERDPYAEGYVRTSTATMSVSTGWIIELGKLPTSETEVGSGSASGTQMAVRVRNHPDPNQVRHYFYNLEPAGCASVVEVRPRDQSGTVELHAGEYVVLGVHPGPLPKPLPIPPDDEFVAFLRQRAQAAGLDLEE